MMAFLSAEVSAFETWLPWGSPVGTDRLAFHRHRVHQLSQVGRSNPLWAVSSPPPSFLLFGFLPRSFYQADWGHTTCQQHELRFRAHYSLLRRGPSVSFLTSMGAPQGPSHLVSRPRSVPRGQFQSYIISRGHKLHTASDQRRYIKSLNV